MINWNAKIPEVCAYGTAADYCQLPDATQRCSGVAPLDSLPAAWWNAMWHDNNNAFNCSRALVNNVGQELCNIITCRGGTLNANCNSQLYNTIFAVGTANALGMVKSSTTAGQVAIGNDGVMTVNGYSDLSTTVGNQGTTIGNQGTAIGSLQTCVGNTTLETTEQTLTAAINEVRCALCDYNPVTYSTTNPEALGTATPGTATTVARSDHVHPIGCCICVCSDNTNWASISSGVTSDGYSCNMIQAQANCSVNRMYVSGSLARNSLCSTGANGGNMIYTCGSNGFNAVRSDGACGYNGLSAIGCCGYNSITATGKCGHNQICACGCWGYNLIGAYGAYGCNLIEACGVYGYNKLTAAGVNGYNQLYTDGCYGYNQLCAGGDHGYNRIWATGCCGYNRIWAAGCCGYNQLYTDGCCGYNKLSATGDCGYNTMSAYGNYGYNLIAATGPHGCNMICAISDSRVTNCILTTKHSSTDLESGEEYLTEICTRTGTAENATYTIIQQLRNPAYNQMLLGAVDLGSATATTEPTGIEIAAMACYVKCNRSPYVCIHTGGNGYSGGSSLTLSTRSPSTTASEAQACNYGYLQHDGNLVAFNIGRKYSDSISLATNVFNIDLDSYCSDYGSRSCTYTPKMSVTHGILDAIPLLKDFEVRYCCICGSAGSYTHEIFINTGGQGRCYGCGGCSACKVFFSPTFGLIQNYTDNSWHSLGRCVTNSCASSYNTVEWGLMAYKE